VLLPQPGWHRVAVAAILVIPLLTLILLSLPAYITWPFLSTERRTTVLWRRARPAYLAEPPLQHGLRRREPPLTRLHPRTSAALLRSVYVPLWSGR
jgi:hypothetical protein